MLTVFIMIMWVFWVFFFLVSVRGYEWKHRSHFVIVLHREQQKSSCSWRESIMHPFFSVHFISRRSLQQKAPPPHIQYAQLKIWSGCGLNKVLISDEKQSYNGGSCSENWLVLLKRMMLWAVLVHNRRGITFTIQLLGLSDCPFLCLSSSML